LVHHYCISFCTHAILSISIAFASYTVGFRPFFGIYLSNYHIILSNLLAFTSNPQSIELCVFIEFSSQVADLCSFLMFYSWLTVLSVFNLSWFWDWQLYLFVYISELTIMSVLVFGSTIDDFVCFSHVWFSDRRVFLPSLCLVREWRLLIFFLYGSEMNEFVCFSHVWFSNNSICLSHVWFSDRRFRLSSSCLFREWRLRLFSSYIVLSFKILFVFLMFGSYIGSFSVFTMFSSQNDDFDCLAYVWFWIWRFCRFCSGLVLK
jgi:hypothetical protein